MGEIQSALQQVQFSLSQVLTNQQQLWTKLESLENNASQQLTHLASQVQSIQSLRLTHSKEHKALEFQRDGSDFDKAQLSNASLPPLPNE